MKRKIAALIAAGALLSTVPANADHDPSPGSPAWIQRDLANQQYATQRQQDMASNPEAGRIYWTTAIPVWIDGFADQLRNPDRPAPGLSRILPGEAADPYRQHWDGARGIASPIEYLSRCGGRIQGTILGPKVGAPDPHFPSRTLQPPFPGVVITTGSIQGYEELYWWAAQGLAEAGYVVMTYDVMGQGESEWACHGGGSSTGFFNGTLDALNFFLSDANPMGGLLDASRIGLAGHSAGASAVTDVANRVSIEIRPGVTIPNPVDAVIGWDNVALPASVAPRVPTMGQAAEYFFNPTPNFTAPSAGAKNGVFNRFVTAGIDAMQVNLRGSTHLEWTFVPYILPASRKGERVAMHYTLAWFDRYLKGASDAAVRADATARLVSKTFDASSDRSSIGWGTWDAATNRNVPNTIAGDRVADHMSFYYTSVYSVGGAACSDMRHECP